ncbi:hypothetical protein, partial [Mesorhizobium sp. M7A.F.Ca.CA.004.12.1.1]|uniref:hypothetical protein n=1 Tax=Mesorhizobium sp. M7A.F.Ca.CA.004.12.1.1 TaxID=2496732 RepID=UPI0019D0010F
IKARNAKVTAVRIQFSPKLRPDLTRQLPVSHPVALSLPAADRAKQLLPRMRKLLLWRMDFYDPVRAAPNLAASILSHRPLMTIQPKD